MGSAGPETRLVARIVAAIKAAHPEAWVVKIHGNPYQSAGIPDLLVVLGGRLAGLEVKAVRHGETAEHARKRATLRQLATLAAIERAGGVGRVVLSVEEALGVVSGLDLTLDR